MRDSHPKPWRVLREEHLQHCRVFDVHVATMESPHTGTAHPFYRIESPAWVNVVALTPHDELVMVRQFRQGSRVVTLEVPGGLVDPGESPEQAAARELIEETGYRADRLACLGSLNPNPALFGNPPPTPGVTPAAILEDGDTITCGDLVFQMIATPGHSPGLQVAYNADSGQALVGDLIFAMGIGRTDFPGSNHDDMVRSLARIFDELPGDTVIYPGHDRWGVTLAQAEPYARMFM